MKCTACGKFYDSSKQECPECNTSNNVLQMQQTFNARPVPIEIEMSNQGWIAKVRRQYNLVDKYFIAITENWTKDRCMAELKKFWIGQIALKKISHGVPVKFTMLNQEK